MEKRIVSLCKYFLFLVVIEFCEIVMFWGEDEINVFGFFWYGVSWMIIKVNCFRDLKVFVVGKVFKIVILDCFISFVFS